MADTSALVVGWDVTAYDDPRYWLAPRAKPGGQKDNDLVLIPADAMATHTVIVAQSGAGKSALIGRIVEELLLRTRARCVVLDPNSDFLRVHEVESADLWRLAKFDALKRTGRLPHETSQTVFKRAWRKVVKKVSVGTKERDPGQREQLQLWWPSLSVEFLSEGLDPMLRGEFYHCHVFAQAVAALASLRPQTPTEARNPIEIAEEVHTLARQILNSIYATEDLRREAVQKALETTLLAGSTEKLTAETMSQALFPFLSHAGASPTLLRFLVENRRATHIERAMVALNYFSADVAKFYFGKAREINAAGILSSRPLASDGPREQLHVIDIPSLKDHSTQLLAISAVLETEWRQARSDWEHALTRPPSEDIRAPTFIVVDEAHNLVPDSVTGTGEAKLREQFRTIVAEGRKFGVFLILVSQRPDKLDRRVLSECENKAVMRLDSNYVLDLTKEILGLDDVADRLLEKTLGFGLGRALIIGRWAAGTPKVLYTAARRTVEGGRNLRPAYWATPWEIAEAKVPKKAKKRKTVRKTLRARRRRK